jgi:hypothetical protein
VTKEVCSDKPKEVCRNESRTVSKLVSSTVCDKVCTTRNEEKCDPVEPKIVCNTIVKQMSYPVPVLVCD